MEVQQCHILPHHAAACELATVYLIPEAPPSVNFVASWMQYLLLFKKSKWCDSLQLQISTFCALRVVQEIKCQLAIA